MINKLKNRFQPLIYRAIKWHYRKPRILTKRGITLLLHPTVFHPTYYLSTDIFLDYLLTQPIENKAILELGTGNGFTALYLAKNKNTQTYASDINPKAIEGLTQNATTNDVNVQTYLSDLFDEIPFLELDYIIVNPPYFAKEINSVEEYAFFTGKDLAYFKKFFKQIKLYLESQTKVLMVLSENAVISEIEALAKQVAMTMHIAHQETKNNELFLIYELSLLESK